MIYLFRCEGCGYEHEYLASIMRGPPPETACWECKDGMLVRVWTPPNIICDNNPDFVPLGARVTENTGFGDTKAQGHRKEANYQRYVQERRKELQENRNKKSNLRHTHSIPTELFHGKIKQTGDRHYWDDPANLKKHKTSEVS